MGLINLILTNPLFKYFAKKKGYDEATFKFLAMVFDLWNTPEEEFLNQILPIISKSSLQAFLNCLYMQKNIDWIWPYFAEKQLNDQNIDFISRGNYPFLFNSSFRNWTPIGLVNSPVRSIIDPSGLITANLDGWSIDFWVKEGDKIFFPSKQKSISQTINENFPLITSSFSTQDFEVRTKIFPFGIDKNNFLLAKVSVSNISLDKKPTSVYLAIRPYNPEGISPIYEITFSDKYVNVNGKLGVIFTTTPDKLDCSNENDGDISNRINGLKNNKKIKCNKGLCTGIAEFNNEINSGDEISYTFIIPTKNVSDNVNSLIDRLYALNEGEIFKKFVDDWEWELKKTMEITIPDEKMQSAFNTNKMYLLLLANEDLIMKDSFLNRKFNLEDVASILTSLDKIGVYSVVERILTAFTKIQTPEGYFIFQNGRWDTNGQILWTIWQHYLYSRDKNFLKKLYVYVRRGLTWIERKRRTTKSKIGLKHFGLFPVGISPQIFDLPNFYYRDNFWGLVGLRDSICISRELGFLKDKSKLEQYYFGFQDDINKSLDFLSSKLGKKIITASPYRNFDFSAIYSICSLYPLRIFNPFEEIITNTLEELKRFSLSEDGLFSHQIHKGISVYLTLQYAECLLLRKEQAAFRIIENVMNLATSTYNWPASINPITKGGIWGDGFHLNASAEFLHIIRNLLFFEEDNKIVVFPSIPKNWVLEGKVIKVQNAPSYFGNVTFNAVFVKGRATINFDIKRNEYLKEIEVNMPVSIRNVFVDGEEKIITDDKKITLENNVKLVELIIDN